MKYLLLILSVLFLNPAFGQKKPEAKASPVNGFAIVELFTNGGSAVCPPADSLLSKLNAEALKSNQKIYTLAYHVDYWNHFGWIDPYSSLAFSNRQKDYMFKLNLKDMSIPQIIVNGNASFVGSQPKKVRTTVSSALQQQAAVNLEIRKDSILHDTLFISYNANAGDKNYYLRIAVVEAGLTSAPDAGDTKGLKLSHCNVVRVFFSKDMDSKTGQAKVAMRKHVPNKNYSIIAFVQHKKSSKILGAVQIGF